jgi:hypothetical protein
MLDGSRPKLDGLQSESSIQAQCVTWFKNNYRQIRQLLYKNHNEGWKSAKTAMIDKAMGLTAGIPDTFLAIPTNGFHGFYIEFKRPGESLKPDQKQVIELLKNQGYKVEVLTSLADFQKAIFEYLSTTMYHVKTD